MEFFRLQAVVLAAGTSPALNTTRTKLLEKICGQELVVYPTKLLASLAIPTTVVVGYERECIQETLTRYHGDTLSFVVQEEQHGTGHALLCARTTLSGDDILIINGDMPLVTEAIITRLYAKHKETGATISFVTAHNADPSLDGYGRVVRTDNQIRIIEAQEFVSDSHEYCCINAGIYIVKRSFLEESIDEIEKNKNSKEFYFTQVIKIASDQEKPIATISAPFDCIRGINTFQELWAAEQIKRAELIKYWMDNGVRFSVAQNVHIDLHVTIGAGSHIGSGVQLTGSTTIGTDCHIHEFSTLDNVHLGNSSIIYSHSIIKNSTVGAHAHIGPLAHVHENTKVSDKTVIGNFVEAKRSIIGLHTKAKHLAYLGDAVIGENVNIGSGTSICNHDGFSKHRTIIADNAYIGTNSTLVAPVSIGNDAFIAAGSTITKDIPAYALAIARMRQTNKEGYVHRLREKKQKKNNEVASMHKTTIAPEGSNTPHYFVGATKTESENNPFDRP